MMNTSSHEERERSRCRDGHRAFHDLYNLEKGEVIHSVEVCKQAGYELSSRGRWSLTLQNVAGKDGGKAEKPVLRFEDRGASIIGGMSVAIDAFEKHGKILETHGLVEFPFL